MKKLLLFISVFAFLSINAQTKWVQQNSTITSSLHAVHFADLFNGCAVGIGGKILTTTDGGYNWTLQTVGTTTWYDVFYISPLKGWIVGNGGKILGSTDGGATWVEQSTAGEQLNAIYFIDENTGFAVGDNGAFKYTANGGTTWTVDNNTLTFPNMNDLYFSDASNGFAVCDMGKVQKTTDGGLNWTQVSTPVNKNLNGLSMVSISTGYAVGNEGYMIKTTDGGATWTEVTSPAGLSNLIACDFITEMEGYIVSAEYTTSTEGKIYHTIDGGANWEDVTPAGFVGTWYDICALNEKLVWAGGDGGVIVRKDSYDKICMVTVDQEYNKNKVCWEKVDGIGTAFYKVYTLDGTDYNVKDTVYFGELSDWMDFASDPSSVSERYKISSVDAFGNESALSPYHQTINLINTYNSTTHTAGLVWNPYEIEDGSFITGYYHVYYGISTTAMELLDSTDVGGATSFNHTDVYEAYYYYIGMDKNPPCVPTGAKDVGGPYSQSVSNLEDTNIDTGGWVNQNAILYAKIYPNPTSSNAYVQFVNPKNLKYELIITDITGKIIPATYTPISSSRFLLDVSEFIPGVYFVEVRGEKVFWGKVVVE